MMDKRPKPLGEKLEPEIIPPEYTGRRTAQGPPRIRTFVDTRGTKHVYVARLGPVGIILVVLTTAILSAVVLILLLGAFLIWIPVVAFLVAGAVIAGLLRGYFQRMRVEADSSARTNAAGRYDEESHTRLGSEKFERF
jgi:hypothetical protein